MPPFTEVVSLDFEDHPFDIQTFESPAPCAAGRNVYLDEVILDDQGGHMYVCSDTDNCETAGPRLPVVPLGARVRAGGLSGHDGTSCSTPPIPHEVALLHHPHPVTKGPHLPHKGEGAPRKETLNDHEPLLHVDSLPNTTALARLRRCEF